MITDEYAGSSGRDYSLDSVMRIPAPPTAAPPRRRRAQDIQNSNAAWDRQAHLLHAQRIAATPTELDFRLQLATQEQATLVEFAARPVACMREGCDGACRPQSALQLGIPKQQNAVLIVMSTTHVWASIPLLECDVCATTMPMQPAQVPIAIFSLLQS